MKSENSMNRIDTPVCLFTWKRWDTVSKIIERLKEANVLRIYVKSDCWRNDEEKPLVSFVRKKLLTAFDWGCNVTFLFEDENKGVYRQIGIGAIEIFQREEACIFLEDDNLPEVSFFKYCEDLLQKYKDNENIFMICGTNYHGEWSSKNDYMFVKALLPCGWASWSKKFIKYYDKTLEWFDKPSNLKYFLSKYKSGALGKQQLNSILSERKLFLSEHRFRSWDYHAIASIMKNDLLVISPRLNQITNIGVDEYGIHNFKSIKKNVMTKRFCEVSSYPLCFPLVHPINIQIDKKYQKYCDKTITLPFFLRLKKCLSKIYRKFIPKKVANN